MKTTIFKTALIFLFVLFSACIITSYEANAFTEVLYKKLFFTGQIDNVNINEIDGGFNINLNTEGLEEGYYTAYFTPNEHLDLIDLGGASLEVKNISDEVLKMNFSGSDENAEYKLQDNIKILKKNIETGVLEDAIVEYGTINIDKNEECILYIPLSALNMQDTKGLYNFGFAITTEASKKQNFDVKNFILLNKEEIQEVNNIKLMKVIGDEEITIPSEGESVSNYYVENLDSKVYFDIVEGARGVYIDGDGNLHVKSAADEGTITIKVEGEDKTVLYKEVKLKNSWTKTVEGERYEIPDNLTAKDGKFISFFTDKSNIVLVRAAIVMTIFIATVLFLYWRKIININWKYILGLMGFFTLILSIIIGFQVFSYTKSEPPNINKTMNIGNAMEAAKGETWDVTMSVEYIDKIKEAGFDAVRIPVRFSDYAKDSKDYIIDENFMKEVDYYVNYALSQDLNVILDMHNFIEIMENPLENRELFLSMWDQISKRYKNYSNNLVYELLNEPKENLNIDTWNKLLKDAVKTVRQNDKKKYLVIGGCNFNSYEELLKLDVPKDNNLILTFHYYNPDNFTFQGADYHEGFENLHDIQWNGTEEEIKEIDTAFKSVSEFAKKKNLTVFVGEFGANKKAPYNCRVLWTKNVREMAEKYDFSWGYWEMASTFGIYDKEKHVFDEGMLNALIDTKEE